MQLRRALFSSRITQIPHKSAGAVSDGEKSWAVAGAAPLKLASLQKAEMLNVLINSRICERCDLGGGRRAGAFCTAARNGARITAKLSRAARDSEFPSRRNEARWELGENEKP